MDGIKAGRIAGSGCAENLRGDKLNFPRPFDDDFNSSLVFRNHVRGQDAAPEDIWINHRAASDDAARVQHGVAAHFRTVTEQRTEFAQAGVKRLSVQFQLDVAGKELVIGDLHARAEVRLVAEDGVADIIEMRRLRTIEQQRVFQFGRVADDTAVADDDVFPDIGAMSDLAVFADDGRAFDHRTVLDHRAFTDKHFFADERPAFAGVAQFRFQMCDNVGFDFFQGFPREFAAVKDGGVFRLAEVKQVGWFEHAATVTKHLRWESAILPVFLENNQKKQIASRRFAPGNGSVSWRGRSYGRAAQVSIFQET